jgi:hypothetical protein
MQIAIQAIKEFAAAAGAVESTWVAPAKMKILEQLKEAFEAKSLKLIPLQLNKIVMQHLMHLCRSCCSIRS